MNGKKARKLREIARKATIGSQDIEYFAGVAPTYAPNYQYGTDIFIGFSKVVKGIPAQLKRGCTRFVYQKLKLNFK